MTKTLILLSVLLCGCAMKHASKFQPTAADEQLMRDFYGKPYLDAPKGWHWVCSDFNIPSERCYIDRNLTSKARERESRLTKPGNHIIFPFL